jgi:hypothetical protein
MQPAAGATIQARSAGGLQAGRLQAAEQRLQQQGVVLLLLLLRLQPLATLLVTTQTRQLQHVPHLAATCGAGGGGGCNVATFSSGNEQASSSSGSSDNTPEAPSCSSSSYHGAGEANGTARIFIDAPIGCGKSTLVLLNNRNNCNNNNNGSVCSSAGLTAAEAIPSCKVAVWGDAFPDMGEECSSGTSGLAAVADGTLKQQKPVGFYQPQPRITRSSSARAMLQNIGLNSAGTSNTPAATGSNSSTGNESGTDTPIELDASTTMLPNGSSNMLVAISSRTDGALLARLLQSGAHTSLCPTIVNVPAVNMRELLDRGVISLQTPAAATPALLAAMAAAAAKGYQPSRELPALQTGEETTLMFVEPRAFRLYDERTGKSSSNLRLLLDSGALGALSSKQLTDSSGWSWHATPGMTIAAAGSPRPQVEGILDDVKLIMLPGTPHATAVQFDALVMPGVEGTYDAIMGLAQLTQLGIVVDFGTRECFMRSPLTGQLLPIPVRCTRKSRLAVASSSTPVACPAFPNPERPLEEQLLRYIDDTTYNNGAATVVVNHAAAGRRYITWRDFVDYRILNAHVQRLEEATNNRNGYKEAQLMASGDINPNPGPLLAQRSNDWEGFKEAQLMASGDVNPNPGPLLGQRGFKSAWWQYCSLMLVMSALCVQAAYAFAAAVNNAPARAMLAVAAMWVLAWVCLPIAATWAFMSTVVPTWWHFIVRPFTGRPPGRVRKWRCWRLVQGATAG